MSTKFGDVENLSYMSYICIKGKMEWFCYPSKADKQINSPKVASHLQSCAEIPKRIKI